LTLTNLHHTDAAPPPPPITTRAATCLIVLYALSYFIPFYLSSTTRPSATLSRDAPSVIRARIRSVTLSCLVCTGVTYVVLSRPGNGDTTPPREVLHLLGLWPVAAWDSLRALFLTALLFAGPLFSYLVVERGWADWVRLGPVKEVWQEWTVWRNIVAVCYPLSFHHQPPSPPTSLAPTTHHPPTNPPSPTHRAP
jgi:prenyl protein peptidase